MNKLMNKMLAVFTPPTSGAFLLAALAAFVDSCTRGAFPPVDFRAVCLHRAMVMMGDDGVRIVYVFDWVVWEEGRFLCLPLFATLY